MEKKVTTPVTAGLLISLILIVISLVLYFTGLFTETCAQYCGFVVLVGGVIWSIINHGKEKDSNVTFGKLFGFGFKVAMVVACMMILYTVLSGYLFPDVKRRIIEMATDKALSKPDANEEAIRKGMDLFEKYYTLFLVLGILFWYLVLGVITSLIGAAVTKKRPMTPFENV